MADNALPTIGSITTPLEEQVMKDYGKYVYKAVDVPAFTPPSRRAQYTVPSMGNIGLMGMRSPASIAKAKEAYDKDLAALGSALPAGVRLVGTQLQIDPSSSLYNLDPTKTNFLAEIRNQAAKEAQLRDYNAKLAASGQPTVSALPSGLGANVALTAMRIPTLSSYGATAGAPRNNGFMGLGNLTGISRGLNKPYDGPLDILGGDAISSNNLMNPMSRIGGLGLNLRNRQPNLPKVTEVEATRNMEEALAEYLRKQPGMTLDQLRAQQDAKRAAMGNIQQNALLPNQQNQAIVNQYTQEAQPQQINDMLNKYTQPQQGFAEGGAVRGYAVGGTARSDLLGSEARRPSIASMSIFGQPSNNTPFPQNKPRSIFGMTNLSAGPNVVTVAAEPEMSLAEYEEKVKAIRDAAYRELKNKYAQGGMVKGYAEGGEKEEDPYAYAPIPAPEMQQTMAPNFMPVTTGQVEPAGGGYVAPAPAMAMANPELNALLQQYSTGTDYGPELKQARADRRASEEAFGKTLDSLMTSADEGPSKAEMYFRLAAAFGTPSKTGAFAEGLGQAGAAMAETKKEERASRTAKRKLGAEIAMKKQELALEGAKDTEKTLLGLQSEANKDKREFIKAQVKEYIDSGKPQSNAGKIAKDKGFKPGTPEYQEEVDKQVNLEIEKQVGAIKLQLQSGNIALANLGIAQEKASREAIKLEPDERKAIRDDEDAMFAAKNTIKNLNTAIGYVDQAFSSTKADQAAYKKLKETNPNDPRVKATEELENLIGQNVVGSLKTTFGGNPTEGERRALQELGGLGSANKEVRKAIMKRAAKALEEAADYRSARITKIETGGYRKKTEEK